MSSDPPNTAPRPKQAILREVYESNRRLNDGVTGTASPVARATPHRPGRLRWLLALPLVAAAVALAAWNAPGPPRAELPVATARVAPADSTPEPVATKTETTETPAPSATRPPFADETKTAGSPVGFLPPLPNDLRVPQALLAAATAPRPAHGAVPRDAAPSDALAVYSGDGFDDVSLRSLFGLGVRTIVIDPGHGGIDPGTSGKLGTREKDVTLAVAQRLKALLEHDRSYRVLLTRETDVTTSLSERVALANDAAVDLFVSIHVNYLPNTTLNVIETYYFGAHSDADALRLAEHENRGSDYGMSDFESLVRNMRDTIKLQESKRLAAAIQSSLTGNMQRTKRELFDVGIKTAPFVVLLGVKAPAVLAEISCMCNPEAERRLRTPAHREEVARYIAEGIVDYLEANTRKGDESNDRQRQAKKS